jgi:hypothetical protein
MPGLVLHVGAQVSCLHQIPATIPPTPRVFVSTMAVATAPSLPVAPGCPFQVPVGATTKPQPCTTIKWANVSARVRVFGQPLLLQAPPGPGVGNGGCLSVAIPNGPANVKAMQTRVFAM